ncbi:hypothetical protein P7C70_g5388, partial [Phenoliferia sp. Uapishka_3]
MLVNLNSRSEPGDNLHFVGTLNYIRDDTTGRFPIEGAQVESLRSIRIDQPEPIEPPLQTNILREGNLAHATEKEEEDEISDAVPARRRNGIDAPTVGQWMEKYWEPPLGNNQM